MTMRRVRASLQRFSAARNTRPAFLIVIPYQGDAHGQLTQHNPARKSQLTAYCFATLPTKRKTTRNTIGLLLRYVGRLTSSSHARSSSTRDRPNIGSWHPCSFRPCGLGGGKQEVGEEQPLGVLTWGWQHHQQEACSLDHHRH